MNSGKGGKRSDRGALLTSLTSLTYLAYLACLTYLRSLPVSRAPSNQQKLFIISFQEGNMRFDAFSIFGHPPQSM